MRSDSLASHLRVATGATFLFMLCQVVAETVLIAIRAHNFVISPHEFFGNQMYDFCVKLIMAVPSGASWVGGGTLNRFIPAGFYPKLVLGGALLPPNLLLAILLGVLLGFGRYVLRRPARVAPVIWTLIALAMIVHLVSWGLGVHIPKGWTIRSLVRNTGRVFVWQGTYIAMLVVLIAAAATALLGRLRIGLQFGVALGLAVAVGVVLVMIPPVPAASIGPYDDARVAGTARADNVILISIDSLRSDRVGCYGNDRNTTPALDKLAREGVRFDNAMSSTSWTLPAHMSLLTGRSVLSHGVITEKDSLPAGVPTLAESLRHAGIYTDGIVSVPLLGAQYGFARGFDHYDDKTIPSPTWFDALKDEPAPMVAKLATEFLQQHSNERFFLFLHFWDVHYDYAPPPPYDTMFDPDYHGSVSGVDFFQNNAINRKLPKRDIQHLLALYDGEIRWVDDHIGKILQVVDQLGLAPRTAIIVTADHGDEFFEHGFKGHGRTLYREVVQVPLIMRAPGIKPGEVVHDAVSLVDIAPTILDLTGVPDPPGLSGTTLLPATVGRALARRPAVYAWLCSLKQKTDCLAMQHSDRGTLIHLFQPLRIEFYDPSDLLEHRNLARAGKWPRQKQLSLLSSGLNAQWKAYRELGSHRGGLKVDKATEDRLRALGYVD